MNRSRFLILGVVSVLLGLAAGFYVYHKIQVVKSPSEPMAEAFAAATDLQVGARIGADDIRVIHVPLSALPPDPPRKRADLIGRGVVTPIAKGQFIVSVQLAGENSGSGLPSLDGTLPSVTVTRTGEKTVSTGWKYIPPMTKR